LVLPNNSDCQTNWKINGGPTAKQGHPNGRHSSTIAHERVWRDVILASSWMLDAGLIQHAPPPKPILIPIVCPKTGKKKNWDAMRNAMAGRVT